MDDERRAYVHELMLAMDPGADPAGPGAVVTAALCGGWEHEGPCRWPHHTAVSPAGDALRVRTVFVAAPEDEHEVRARIASALVHAPGWFVIAGGPSQVTEDEAALAGRLLAGPFRQGA